MARYIFEDIAINSTKKKKPVEDDKYTYLGLENLDPETLRVTRFGNEVAPIGEKLIMQKGDVLFGKRRAYQKKVAIAPFDGIFSAHGMVLKPKTNVIHPDFFPFFISSDYFLDNAIRISVGSLSPTINWGDLKKLEFDLPSFAEQTKLAKVLWAITNTIESYNDFIVRAKSLSNALLEKKQSEYPDLKYVDFGTLVEYKKKSSIKAGEGKDVGEFPFFTSSNEQTKWINDYLFDDECLIVGTGGVASVNYYDGKFAVSTDCFTLSSKDGYSIKLLYLYLLNKIDVIQFGFRGVGLQHLSKDYLNSIPVPLLNSDQQEEILMMLNTINDSINIAEDNLIKAKILFKKISAENICKKED